MFSNHLCKFSKYLWSSRDWTTKDECDEFKRVFDYRETLDDSDEDDLVITSGPPQLRSKSSPAKVPPTPMPQKEPAPKVILEDDDDDETWMMVAPTKLPSTLPGLGSHTLQVQRLRRKELQMLQESSTPEAITRVEDQARMQAQKRPEVVQLPLVLNTPNSSRVHGKSPLIEAEEKEKILINVLDKDGDIQPIRIFKTDKFERLFGVYAEVYHLLLADLSFRFDGEQLTPDSSPQYHTVEDGELIEVYKRI